MDILLYKDGHLAVSESPLEGKENNLKDVVMLITNPQEGDSLTYKGGKWVNGAGGSGGGGLVVHMNVDQSTHRAELDKTWKEINDALAAGGSVSIDNTRGGYSSMVTTMADETDYIVVAQLPSASANINSMKFFANAENELPVFSNGGEG